MPFCQYFVWALACLVVWGVLGFVLLGSALFFGVVLCVVVFGEFDPGSGRTLAACLTHASRTGLLALLWGVGGLVANG